MRAKINSCSIGPLRRSLAETMVGETNSRGQVQFGGQLIVETETMDVICASLSLALNVAEGQIFEYILSHCKLEQSAE